MLVTVLAVLSALVVSSLVEYWGHRLMHQRWMLGRRHAEHHRVGTGQGVLGEFRDYLGAVPIIGWLGFLYSVQAGIAFLAGAVLFGFFAAYSHQINHERPSCSSGCRARSTISTTSTSCGSTTSRSPSTCGTACSAPTSHRVAPRAPPVRPPARGVLPDQVALSAPPTQHCLAFRTWHLALST